MKTNIFPKNVYKVCSLVFSKYRWKLRDSANSCFFTWMYFKSLLSASPSQNLNYPIPQLRSYFKKCKFRIWFCRLWKCFKNNNNNNKKIDSFWSPLFTFLATRTKAAVFLRENKPMSLKRFRSVLCFRNGFTSACSHCPLCHIFISLIANFHKISEKET